MTEMASARSDLRSLLTNNHARLSVTMPTIGCDLIGRVLIPGSVSA
jgi:hypothetical protein